MDKFLEKYNFSKLNEEEAESMNRPITADEIKAVIKKILAHKSPGPHSFTRQFYKIFKEELTNIILKTLKKKKVKKRVDSQTLYKASIIAIPKLD